MIRVFWVKGGNCWLLALKGLVVPACLAFLGLVVRVFRSVRSLVGLVFRVARSLVGLVVPACLAFLGLVVRVVRSLVLLRWVVRGCQVRWVRWECRVASSLAVLRRVVLTSLVAHSLAVPVASAARSRSVALAVPVASAARSRSVALAVPVVRNRLVDLQALVLQQELGLNLDLCQLSKCSTLGNLSG